MKQLFFTLLVASLFASCGELTVPNHKSKIEVISNGQVIKTYTSSGAVMFGRNSAQFYDLETGKKIDVFGEFIVTQID